MATDTNLNPWYVIPLRWDGFAEEYTSDVRMSDERYWHGRTFTSHSAAQEAVAESDLDAADICNDSTGEQIRY